MSNGTSNNLIGRFEAAGLLEETTGRPRNRRYRYSAYLELFADRAQAAEGSGPIQLTESGTNRRA